MPPGSAAFDTRHLYLFSQLKPVNPCSLLPTRRHPLLNVTEEVQGTSTAVVLMMGLVVSLGQEMVRMRLEVCKWVFRINIWKGIQMCSLH